MRTMSLALVSGLNLFLRRKLPADLFDQLQGKEVEIALKRAGARAAFRVQGRHFVPIRPSGSPHVRFRAAARDFALIAARAEDADTLYFNRRLVVEGNTEAALLIKNTLDSVEFPRSRALLKRVLRQA